MSLSSLLFTSSSAGVELDLGGWLFFFLSKGCALWEACAMGLPRRSVAMLSVWRQRGGDRTETERMSERETTRKKKELLRYKA